MRKILIASLLIMALVLCLTSCSSEVADFADKPDVAQDSGKVTTSEYVRGTIDGNLYESEFVGLRFNATEDMMFHSEEELFELMGVGVDMLGVDEDYAEKLSQIAQLTTVYEMMVSDGFGNNLILMVEKLYRPVTVEEYIDALKNQLTQLTGETPEFTDIETVKIGGVEFSRVTYVNTMYGVEMLQTYDMYKKGDRLVAIIGTAVTDDIEKLYSGFSAY